MQAIIPTAAFVAGSVLISNLRIISLNVGFGYPACLCFPAVAILPGSQACYLLLALRPMQSGDQPRYCIILIKRVFFDSPMDSGMSLEGP